MKIDAAAPTKDEIVTHLYNGDSNHLVVTSALTLIKSMNAVACARAFVHPNDSQGASKKMGRQIALGRLRKNAKKLVDNPVEMSSIASGEEIIVIDVSRDRFDDIDKFDVRNKDGTWCRTPFVCETLAYNKPMLSFVLFCVCDKNLNNQHMFTDNELNAINRLFKRLEKETKSE